jgi:hypothetical protein
MPADAAAGLTVRERMVLFCAASDTYWAHAGITAEVVTGMLVKGLIERDTGGQIMPTDRGERCCGRRWVNCDDAEDGRRPSRRAMAAAPQ